MAITAKPGFAHRFGHAVGTVIRRFLAFEPRLARAFRRCGLPPVLVKLLFWSIKLAVIAALLYVAFWAAIFVAGLFILAAIGEGVEQSGNFGSDYEVEQEESVSWSESSRYHSTEQTGLYR